MAKKPAPTPRRARSAASGSIPTDVQLAMVFEDNRRQFALLRDQHAASEERLQGELARRLDPIREDLDVLKASTDILVRGQAELRQDVVALQHGQTELRQDVAALQQGQTELRQDVAEMKQDIREIKVDLADVKSVVMRHDAQIVELERRPRPARH